MPAVRRRTAIAAALTAGCALAGAAPASATVACEFQNDTLTVGTGSEGDRPSLTREANGNIVVRDSSTVISCGSTQATVLNTDSIVVTEAASGFNQFSIDLNGGSLAPGKTDELLSTTDEIEIEVDMGGAGQNQLIVNGGSGNDSWRAGQTSSGAGINLNAGAENAPLIGQDVDLTYDGVASLVLGGRGGDDTLLASGGGEFTGPLAIPALVGGREGNDTIAGGDEDDDLNGGEGDDQMHGGAGDDSLNQDADDTGDDSLEGGAGTDTGDYRLDNDAPIRLDLGLAGPQDTGGAGLDSVSGIENVKTADGNDVVIGNDDPNRLETNAGDDLLMGRGSDDVLFGLAGVDTLSYELPPAGATQGVTLDLALQPADATLEGPSQATGGAGTDKVSGFENLVGSPFADNLLGSDGGNDLTGLGGADIVTARGGDDDLALRDGEADGASCGDGSDTVVADLQGVDVLAPDCEGVTFDVPPPPSPATGGGASAAALDGIVPVFTQASQASRVWAVDPAGPAEVQATQRRRRRGVRRGTEFRYTLSEAARVVFTTERRLNGRRVGRRCRKQTRRNRVRRRCTLLVRVGSFAQQGVAGANRKPFSGRIGRRRLRPARYRLTLLATDQAGNRSQPRRLSFGVVPG